MIPFRFHPEARIEARAAAAWYRERSHTAARAFAEILDEGIRSIRELPEAWPSWPGRTDTRRRVLQRFPYSIVYIIDLSAIVVVAVAHQLRKPGYWLPRLSP